MKLYLYGLILVTLVILTLLLVNSLTTSSQAGSTNQNIADQPVSYTVQGDSLQVVSKSYFLQTRPNWQLVSFSAKGGRRAPKELGLLRKQKLGQVVIVSVGTNDWFRPIIQFDQALGKIVDLVGPERCLIMATVYDHGVIEVINKRLRRLASDLGPGRMQLVPWAEMVKAGKIRLADQVHPGTQRDHRYRTQLLIEAAERCLAARYEN